MQNNINLNNLEKEKKETEETEETEEIEETEKTEKTKVETKVEANITMDSLFARVMGGNEGIDFIQQKNAAIEDAEVLNISTPNTQLARELKSLNKNSIRELVEVGV